MKKQNKVQGVKKIKAWAGIIRDRIDHGWIFEDDFNDGIYGIFKTKRQAKEKYEGVIPITISYQLTGKKK